jgi:hypothetical protein
VQRMLSFLDIPIPEIQVWETLQENLKRLAIVVLARLIVQATLKNPGWEGEDHDR